MKSIRLSAAAAALATCLATVGIVPASAFAAAAASPAGSLPGDAGAQPGNETVQAGGPGGHAFSDGPALPDASTGPGGPDGFGPGPHLHGFGGHGPGAPGPDMPPGHLSLQGLQLTDEQQDKVFAIMHAQAPQRREREKAIRKAHEALRDLTHADKFDDTRAAALARDLGQAIAAEALLQARTEAQLLAVLTPEQRARLRQRHACGPGERGPEGGAGPRGRADRR